MGSKKQKKEKEKAKAVGASSASNRHNFVDAAVTAKGCYVAWSNSDGTGFEETLGAEWAIECFPFDEEEWGEASSIPDFSIDPETNVLSVINTSSTRKSYFVSLLREFFACKERARQTFNGGRIPRGADASPQACVTLVIVLAPQTVIDACVLSASRPAQDDSTFPTPSFFSDIKDVPDDIESADAVATSCNTPCVDFPLASGGEPYLCTQGRFGKFTHFFSGTAHAVDFRCPVGTLITAVGDGRVVAVSQSSTATGIHAQNLFRWNSIMIELDRSASSESPLYVYVHIQENSARVRVGDRVAAGDIICASGAVGFCPDPHLHVQFHRSPDNNSPTVPVKFRVGGKSNAIFPQAGVRYF